jgi:hypothetical protein
MESMAVVNGRVMIWGDAPLAIARQHPQWDESGFGELLEYEKNGGTLKGAVCFTKRKDGYKRETHFTIDQAKQAKLWGKAGTWTFYPERMLMFRARGYALRDNFGDALKGLAIRETFDEDEVKPVESNGDQLRGEVEKRKGNKIMDLSKEKGIRPAEHNPNSSAQIIQNAMNQSFPGGDLAANDYKPVMVGAVDRLNELNEARLWLCSVFEKIPIRMGAGTMLKDASLRDGKWISYENIENIDDVEYLKSIAANLEDVLREVKA